MNALAPKQAILSSLQRYSSKVNGAGIRYGSVAYLAFGESWQDEHIGRASTRQYSVEIEVGADRWSLLDGSRKVLDSNFSNIDEARTVWSDALMGRKLLDVGIVSDQAKIIFDHNFALTAVISKTPASGFLFSYQERNGPDWETVDGFMIANE